MSKRVPLANAKTNAQPAEKRGARLVVTAGLGLALALGAAPVVALAEGETTAPAASTVESAGETGEQGTTGVTAGSITIKGEEGATFDTIEDAVEAADAGDTIVLGEGEYTLSDRLDKVVNFEGAGAGTTIVKGSISYYQDGLDTVDGEGPTSISISGLTVAYDSSVYNTTMGILMPSAGVDSLTVSNAEIRGFQYGVAVNSDAAGCEVSVSELVLTDTWCGLSVAERNDNSIKSVGISNPGNSIYAVQTWAFEGATDSKGYYYSTAADYMTDKDNNSLGSGTSVKGSVAETSRPAAGTTSPVVATVNGRNYDNLQTALDAAPEGATVQLTSEPFTVKEASNSGVKNVIVNKPLTIQGAEGGSTINGSLWVMNQINGDVKISGVDFEYIDGAGNQGVCFNGTANSVTIENCSFDGFLYAVGNGGSKGDLHVTNATMTNVWCGVGHQENGGAFIFSLSNDSEVIYAVQSFGGGKLENGYYPTTEAYYKDKATGQLGQNAIDGTAAESERPKVGDPINVLATVGDRNFDNLQMAVNCAAESQTAVELKDDVNLQKAITVPAGKAVVINGNNNAINIKGNGGQGAYTAFTNLDGFSATMEGLKSDTSLTVNDVRFSGPNKGDKSGHAVVVSGNVSGVSVNLTGCTFTDLYDAVYCNFVKEELETPNVVSITGATYNNVAHAYGVDDAATGGARVDAHSFTVDANAPEPETFAEASVDGVGYTDLQEAINTAGDSGTVMVEKDVELSKQLELNKDGLTLNLNGHTITSAEDFVSTYPNDSHVVNVTADNVTIENGTIRATEDNKHVVNVFEADGTTTLRNVVLDHTEGNAGAPLVVNNSDVTLNGTVEFVTGNNSWYAVNVDDKGGEAKLTLAEGATANFTGVKPVGIRVSGTQDKSVIEFEPNSNVTTNIDGFVAITFEGNVEASDTNVVDPGNAGLVPGENGTFVPKPEPSVPSVPSTPSAPTYDVEVPESEGGKVTVSDASPEEGDEVTVTATPDEGQEVRSVTVTDAEGEAVEVEPGDEANTWVFEMPKGDVTVEVTFGCDGGELCPTHSYADLDQAEWYHDAVDWAVTSGAILGYGDGTFGPGRSLTRAEMATILCRLAGEPEADLSSLPSDVPASEWYANGVAWALAEGVFNGNGDGSFDPAGAITREQAACVLYNRAQVAGEDVSARADLSAFADADELSGWAEEAMSWAVAEGVFSGGAAGLEPGRALTRSEGAAILWNWETRAE